MRKNNNIYKILSLCLMLSVCQHAYCASNELVKMNLDQTTDGTVKVNIYTDKPYSEKVIVNKKADNKYVILLPETSNTMNVTPDFSLITGVKNIDVKTKQYSSLPGKEYTKIIIDSRYPINVLPQTHVSANTAESNVQVPLSMPQRAINPVRPVTTSDFEQSNKPVHEQTFYADGNKKQSYTSPKSSTEKIYSQSNTVTNQIKQYEQPTQNNLVKTNGIQSENTIQTTGLTDSSLDTSQKESKEEEETTSTENNQAVDNDSVQTTQEEVKSEKNNTGLSDRELAFIKKIVNVKNKLKNKIKQILSIKLSFSNFMTVLQFILLICLIKIVADLLQKVQNNQANQEQATITKRLIHENENNFENSYPTYSNMDVYNANIDNFEEDNKHGFNMDNAKNNNIKSYVEQNVNSNINNINSINKQNDFYKPLNELNEEERMSIFDDKNEDIEKSIFKNPLTPISKQDEERLFDEDEEPLNQNSPFIEEDDNSVDDFFNYPDNGSLNDENFFIFEDNENGIGSYEENVADENTDEEYEANDDDEYASDDEYDYEEEYEYIDAEDEDDDGEYEYEYEEDEDEDDGYNENDVDYEADEENPTEEYDDSAIEYTEKNNSDDNIENVTHKDVKSKPISKQVQKTLPVNSQSVNKEENNLEKLQLKSKYTIDNKRSFAVVNFNGLNALIGLNGSKVSVLRKFTEDINSKMQVRLNEKPNENTSIYIVKIGKYKTLVEVKPESIRQLLDL